MLFFVGLFIVFGSVLYGFVMAEGQLWTLWQPFELLIILGGAGGAFLLANPLHVVQASGRLVPKVISGGKSQQPLEVGLLGLLADLLNKVRRDGIISIENEVEDTSGSRIFKKYPAIQKNTELTQFVADYLRIMAMGNLTPFELEAMMHQEVEARAYELHRPGAAVGKLADALPGFGIVAAVLGIVITMGAINEDMSSIGSHVAAALVGTFSGVLLAYGVAGPMSSRMHHLAEEEVKLYESVKATLVASLNGMQPAMAIEFGRKALFSHSRPSFAEAEKTARRNRHG